MPIQTRISLSPGVPRVDIHTHLQNQAQDHRLRVHFPAPFSVVSARYDGHFEIVHRPIDPPAFDENWVEQPRPEAPQRLFTDVSDQQAGLLIANRGLPEVQVMKFTDGHTELALTLLRCVGWLSRDDFPTRRGHAGPAMPIPSCQVPGDHDFDYAIVPHSAGEAALEAYRQAYAFNAPVRLMATGIHTGQLPSSACLVEVQPSEFILSAIKTAEDDRGWILRGYSISDHKIQVRLKPSLSFSQAWLSNLAEQRFQPLMPLPDGSLEIQVDPYQVLSVYFSPPG